MIRAIAIAILLAGCLRVGPGEDLALVCEEKSASPRKAYGIETMVDATRIQTAAPLSDEDVLALLEAARGHVVTPSGRAHAGFTATLTDDAPGWLFHGIGVWEGEPQDEYWVRLRAGNGSGIEAGARDGPGPVQAPRTLTDAAWSAVNGTPEAVARLGANASVAWGAWDPALPSCVRLLLASGGSSPEVEVVANIAQGRVVDLG